MEKKLELKNIAPYLPYGLKIRIDTSYGDWDNFSVVELKELDSKGNITTAFDVYNLDSGLIKPVLRPLSDLTKEIEHNGEIVTPIVELAKISEGGEFGYERTIDIRENSKPDMWWVDYENIVDDQIRFCYFNGCLQSGYTRSQTHKPVPNQLQIWYKIYEFHFDIFGLIPKGLAIDINQLS